MMLETTTAASSDSTSTTPLLASTEPVQMNLGKGTSNVTASTKALRFDLRHPALRDFASTFDKAVVAESTGLKQVAT